MTRLHPAERARPLLEKVYDQARTTTVGWPDRRAPHWAVRLADHPHRRGAATTLRFAEPLDGPGPDGS